MMRARLASVVRHSLRLSLYTRCLIPLRHHHQEPTTSNIHKPATFSIDKPATFNGSSFHPSTLEQDWDPPKSDEKVELSRGEEGNLRPTGKWTDDELRYFNLHYYQVTDWNTYFCDSVSNLPQMATDIAAVELSATEIGQNLHFPMLATNPTQFSFCEYLRTTLVEDRTEGSSDALMMNVLVACNESPEINPTPHPKMYTVEVGKNSWFSSKPDLSVKGRTSLYVPVGATLVGIESKPNLTEPKISETEKRSVTEEVLNSNDQTYRKRLVEHFKQQTLTQKQKQPNMAQCQLAGEMLAAALHNYQNQPRKTSHTIFGLRLIGSRLIYCRADFPQDYLESITSNGYPDPDKHITIFRFGGSNTVLGLDLADKNDRPKVLQYLCDVLATCVRLAEAMKKKESHEITTNRIAKLYPQ